MAVDLQYERQLALTLLAPLLEYPDGGYISQIREAEAFLSGKFPGAAASLGQLHQSMKNKKLWELEELFTRTFDLAPTCCLYVSAHLYGDESYDRGGFMARLSQRYEEARFDTGGEMPDHLGVILRFVPMLTREEFDDLNHYCLKKSTEEMAEGLRQSDNPYRYLLDSIRQILDAS